LVKNNLKAINYRPMFQQTVEKWLSYYFSSISYQEQKLEKLTRLSIVKK